MIFVVDDSHHSAHGHATRHWRTNFRAASRSAVVRFGYAPELVGINVHRKRSGPAQTAEQVHRGRVTEDAAPGSRECCVPFSSRRPADQIAKIIIAACLRASHDAVSMCAHLTTRAGALLHTRRRRCGAASVYAEAFTLNSRQCEVFKVHGCLTRRGEIRGLNGEAWPSWWSVPWPCGCGVWRRAERNARRRAR
jgi:hypothetical protein